MPACFHRFLILLTLLGSLSGCSTLNLIPRPDGIPKASKHNPVVEMICLWEAAEGIGMDGMPTRGFAGQILFFTANDKEPVKMDGDIRIYVFDDCGDESEAGKPLHQFDFDSTAFQTFLHDTNLGGAYQLFIPYTRKGGHHATCTLRVRITPPNGQPLYSKMASVILPGTNEKQNELNVSKANKPVQTVQQLSHEIKVHDLRITDDKPTAETPPSAIDRQALRGRLHQIADETTAQLEQQKTSVAKTTRTVHPRSPAKPAADHPLLTD